LDICSLVHIHVGSSAAFDVQKFLNSAGVVKTGIIREGKSPPRKDDPAKNALYIYIQKGGVEVSFVNEPEAVVPVLGPRLPTLVPVVGLGYCR
jgi:hypothetical protein